MKLSDKGRKIYSIFNNLNSFEVSSVSEFGTTYIHSDDSDVYIDLTGVDGYIYSGICHDDGIRFLSIEQFTSYLSKEDKLVVAFNMDVIKDH